MVSVSGRTVWLRPSNIQTKDVTVQWKKRERGSCAKTSEILNWDSSDPKTSTMASSDVYGFDDGDFALSVKSARLQDSGYYLLEITNRSGQTYTKNFQLLIFGEF